MEVKGVITEIEGVQTGTGKNGSWTKQNIIIKTGGEYPKEVCLTAFNKVCDSVDTLNVGDDITAFVNLESRKHQDRWYNEIKLWKFSKQ